MEDIARKPAEDVSMGALLKADRFNMVYIDGIIQCPGRSEHEPS